MGRSRMLEPGAAIPAGELDGLDGARLCLRPGARERDLLLVFFKVSCPTCQLALPFLDRLHRRAPDAVDVCLVSQDDAPPTAAFLRHHGLAAPAFLDREEDGYAVSEAFGIRHVPSLFWVNRRGLVDAALHGFHREDYAALAARAGARIFEPAESVPDWRAG